jgi:hypothetical protein
MAKDKPGRTPFEMNTQVKINEADIPSILMTLSEKANNTYVNGIKETLEAELNNKQNKFIGFTGNFTVIQSIDFASESVVSKTVTVSNGVITGIV